MKKATHGKGLNQLMTMVESSLQPACIYHIEKSKIIAANKAYLKVLNFESTEINDKVLKILSDFLYPQKVDLILREDFSIDPVPISMKSLDGLELHFLARWILRKEENATLIFESLEDIEKLDIPIESKILDQFSMLFAHLQDPCILIDPKSKIIYDANLSALELYDADKSHFMGKPFNQFLQSVQKNEIDPNRFLDELIFEIKTKGSVQFICLSKTRKGFYFETLSSAMIAVNDDQELLIITQQYVNDQVEDQTTELIERENEFLKKQEGRGSQLALKSIHEYADKSNPQAIIESILKTINDSIGADASFIGEFSNQSNMLELPSWKAQNENFFLEGISIEGEFSDSVFAASRSKIFYKNAFQILPEYRFLNDWKISGFAIFPLRSSSNQLLGCLGVLKHESFDENSGIEEALQVFAGRLAFELERKKQFLDIATKGAYFKNVFNNFNDLILIQDEKYKILDVNDTVVNRLGFSKDEIIGKTPVFLSKAGQNKLAQVFRRFDHAFRGIPQKADFWWQTSQNEVFPSELAMQKGMYFGKPVVISIARDITGRHAVEQALKTSKDQYQTLFDGLYDAIFIVELNKFKILDCNEKASELFGYPNKKSMIDVECSMLIADSDLDKLRIEIETLVKNETGKKNHSFIIKCKTSKGLIFDTELTIFSFYDTVDNRVLLLIRNISHQLQAELDLKRQHKFLRLVIDLNPNYIFAKDKDLRFTLANRTMADLYNMTVEEILGKKEEELVSKFLLNRAIIEKERRILKNKETIRIPLEKRIDAKGRVHFLQTTNTIISAGPDNEEQLLGVSTDITERIQAEQALKESEQKIRDTQESAGLGSWEVRFPGEKHWWSDQLYRIFGFNGGEILPAEFIERYLPQDEKARLRSLLNQYLDQNEPHFDVEAKTYIKNGETRYIRIKGKIELGQEKQISSISGIIFDVTDKVLIRQKEREIERLRAEDAINRVQKENLKAELEFSTREISSNLMMSSQQSQLLSSLKAELSKIQDNVPDQEKKRIKNLIFRIQKNINLTEDWEKFKFHFDKVRPDFFDVLKKNHPILSQKDMKHCAYILMGLSAKDVASMLDVNPKSVDMARYRLKKKFKLPSDGSISEYLHSI